MQEILESKLVQNLENDKTVSYKININKKVNKKTKVFLLQEK